MKRYFTALFILFFILQFVCLREEKVLAQSYSIANPAGTTDPSFAPDFSGSPSLPNSALTNSSNFQIRIAGNQNTVMNQMNGVVTTWELRASVSGLDNPVMSTSSDIQYSDIILTNITLTETGGSTNGGTAVVQAPFSGGTATLADILSAGNNALIVSGTGSTVTNTAMNRSNAASGTGSPYWLYSSDLQFTHDFYFNPTTFMPTLIYTLTCTANCF